LKAIKSAVDFVFDKFFGGPLTQDSNQEVLYKPIARNDQDIESEIELVIQNRLFSNLFLNETNQNCDIQS
jgi:hypothetical protein